MDEKESDYGAVEGNTSAYYRKFFGFDPIRERINLQKGFKYETFFPLENDPELHHAGVMIGARVEVQGKGNSRQIHNRIVFKREDKESCVNCVHTAICSLTAAEALNADESRIMELARSTESRPVDLAPADHFVSLKSYVEGLAALGIRNVIGIAYHDQDAYMENLPFGFNGMMQRQIIQALRTIAPSATQALVREFIIGLAEGAPADWFNSRLPAIDEIYNLKEIILSDPRVFEIIDSYTRSLNLRVLAVCYKKTHPAILETITHDPNYDEYRSKAALKEASAKTPQYYFKVVVVGGTTQARNAICNGFYEQRFAGDTQLTIGASIGIRNIGIRNIHTRLIFYNLSDAVRFRFILPDFCRGAKAAIICYDITDEKTFFVDVPYWLKLVRQRNGPGLQVFLLGYNFKKTSEQQITSEIANRYAQEWGCTQNIMISSHLGYNIDETVQAVAEWSLRTTAE